MVPASAMRRGRNVRCVLPLVLAAVAAATAHLAGQGQLVPGANVNMVRGTAFVGGDPFLQRQNEPSLAISTRNPCPLLAGSNDYRTVDFPDPTPLPNEEGVTQAPAQNPRDAWLGVYTSVDCGATWRSVLMPGHPFDTSSVGLASPNRGFTAAADPVVRAGTNGMFFYAGLVFDRADNSRSQIFVSRFIDNNNRERGETIEYIDASVVDVGDPEVFVDKPWLAVDQPRAGALTCDVNGQRFPAGRVYVAWSRFEGGGARLMLSRSADCGRTWQAQALSDTTVTNQGASIAIAPHDGSVYVAWRRFAREGFAASIQLAVSRNGGATFTQTTVASPINAFDQNKLENRRFRTNALPTVTADHLNRVYVAWSERGYARASGRTNPQTGDARIVLAVSANGGTTFAPRYPIDDTLTDADGLPRFGHQVMPSLTFTGGKLQAIYYDFSDDFADVFNPFVDEADTPPIDPNNPNLRRRHTVDVRAASAEPAAQPLFVPVLVTPQGTSPRLSHYRTIVDADGTVRQVQFNPPNLPLFVGGTIPFIGDYIDVAGLNFVPFQGAWRHNNGNTTGPRFDGAFPSTPAFHAVWTDHRDVKAPADGDWTLYKAPGDPFWKMPGSECVPDRAGMRNANVYTARITNGLYAGSPGNTKPLGFQRNPQTGAAIVDPTTGRPVHLQRSFVVFIQNSLPVPTKYLMRIVNQPGAVAGDRASFVRAPQPPFSNADLATRPYIWLVATAPPLSTISRTVFVTSANERAMVRVDILEVAPTVQQNIGNVATTAPAPLATGRRATVLLNPDPTNPTIVDPDFVSPDVPVLAEETHDPQIFDPVVTAIANVTHNAIELRNPDESNPDESNPDESNVDEETPDESNPDESNPDESNPDESNPDESNPDESNIALRNTALNDAQLATASIVDVQWKVKSNANTTTSFRFQPSYSGSRENKAFQLLITKRYYTPAVDGQTCELGVRRSNQVLVNMPGFDPRNPDESNPDESNPDESNPDESNPDESNPDESNPDESNATFFLAPGETATATLRIYDLTTRTPPPPAQLAAFEETASALIESQAPNTGEAAPPRDVAGADLVPINALVSPANAAPGTNAQIAWTLANRGTEATETSSFRTRFMFSTDRDISENDVQLAVVTFTGTVPPDDPSTPTVNEGELPQTTTVTIPSGATTGPRFILLVTDSLNEVPEADEANNAAAAELVGAQALAFVGQPTNTTQGFRFAAPVSVAIVPVAGVPSTVAFVNLAIASGPIGATLSGTLSAPNVSGVATFTNITLSTPGTYTLLATGTGVEGLPVFASPAISSPFTVAVDAPPVAAPDNYAVAAGGVLTVGSASENGLIANDSDAIRSGPGVAPPGRVLVASLVQTTQFGTLALDAAGGFVYQPISGFNGIDFFTYRLNDGVAFGNTTTARIAVGTGEGNAAPVTRPLSITVAEDSVNTPIDVVAAAIDADGDALTILGAGAVNGSAIVSGGRLQYSPDANYSGADTIEYAISDGRGGNTQGVVTVTVTPVNDNPVATNDGPFTVAVNAPSTGFPVLVNDNDGPDSGETLTVVRVGAAGHGSVIFNAAEVRYTPHRDYTGPDSVSYEISDGNGGSASALVTVNVGAANQTPDAVDDAFETTEDVAIASFNVVANDTDADAGDVLTITAVTQPANGLVTFTPGPAADTVRYEPHANFNGIDTFTYTVSDGRDGFDTATVTVTVAPVNDPPVAVDDQAATLRDASIDIDVLANDIDVDKCLGCTSIQRGGELIFFTSDQQAPGSGNYHLWAIRPDGSDLVQLTTGAVLDASSHLRNDGRTLVFGRTVGDVSEIWTLNVATGAVARLIGAPEVPGNAFYPTFSPDGNQLAFVVQNGTSNDVWVSPYPPVPSGFRRVTPADGQTRVFPSWPSNDTILFQIYVPGDAGPSIRAVNVATGTETVIIPSRGGEWYPSVSPDGTLLMWNSERHSTNGDIFVAPYRGASLIPDQEHRRITPASGYNLMDWSPDGRIVAETFPVAGRLVIMNSDGTGLHTVTSSPDRSFAPWWALVARAPLPAGSEATPLQIVALPTVEHGGVLLLPSGRVRFTPEPGYVGMASFTYTVSDGEASDTATVSVAVIAINAPPVATDDSVATPEDTPRSIDVALNDTDPDSDALAIDAFGTGQHGTVEHDTGQPTVLRYIPQGNFNGSDSFTYTIRDGRGHTSTATVHVTVTAVNDAPVFVAALPDHSVQTGAGDTVINLADFVTDVDVATNGDELTFSIDHNTNSSVVTATILGSTLTLDFGVPGTAQVGIRAEDSQDSAAVDAFLVSVGTSNQAPIANNDLVETLTNTPVTINVLANDTDPDRDSGAARVVASIPFNPPGILGNNGSSSGPLAAAPNAPFLYAPGLGGISVIDINSNALVRIVDTPGLVGANRRAVDPATGLVYFSTTGNAVYAIDARAGSPTLHQIVFSTTIGGNRINDLVVDSARGRLYVMSETFTQTGSTATTSHSRIVVIEANVAAPGFGQTLAVVTVANTIGAAMAVNPTNGDVFVGTTGSNSGVRWLNHQTFVLSPITGVLPVLELVVDAVAGRAYGLSSNGQILAVDLATRTLIANSQLAVAGMVSPNAVQTLRHMVVDPDSGRVYLRTNGAAGGPGVVFVLQPGGPTIFWNVLAQIAVARDGGNEDLVLDTVADRLITGSALDFRVDVINTGTNTLDTVAHTRRGVADLELAIVGTNRRVYGSALGSVLPFTLSPFTSPVEVFVGGETGNVVVNPNTHQAFVGFNDTQARVLALDPNGVVGEVPGGLANNAGRYFFALFGTAANQVYVLNTDATSSGSASAVPGYVAVINASGVIATTINAGNGPFGGAINQASGKLHIPAGGRGGQPGGVSVIDPATAVVQPVNTAALFTTVLGRNIGVVDALGKAYVQATVVDTNGSNLAVYTEAGLVATRLPSSFGATNVHLIAVNQTTRRVYVGTQAPGQASRILVINANDDLLETTLNLGSPSTTITSQAYIAIDEPRGRIYIADFANDTVHVLDAVTHALLRTLNVGDGPTSLAINRLSNRIYVGSTLDSRLTFIDGATMTVRGALDLPLAPTSIDVDPGANRIYAAAARSALPAGSGVMVIADDGAFFTHPLSVAFVSGGVNGTPALNPDNTITFTPSPGAGFEGRFNYTVTDGELVSAPATVAIFIRPEMSILTETLPPGAVNAPYNVTLETAHAHGVVRWSASGVLPTGLSLSGTGTLSGTFLASGTFTFTVRAQDESSPNQIATRTYTLSVGPLTLPLVALPIGLVGEPYSFAFVAAGANGATTWSIASGALPNGLSIDASGVISGIPTDVASYPFSVRVTDTAGQIAVGSFSILIDGEPVLIDPPVMSELHSLYNFVPYRVGRTPTTLTVFEGRLPSDLTAGTFITGTPQETGQFPVSLRVTDGRNRLVEGNVTFSAGAADQSLASGGTGATTQTFGPTRRLAQIVTAGVDGLLAGVRSSQLFCSTGDRFTVELRRVTGSNIAVPDENGPPLATAASIVNATAQTTVQFSNFVSFTAGERFALLFSTTGACEFRNVSAVAMGYQHGFAIESAGGGPWQRIAGVNNLAITTIVQPSSLGYFTEGTYTSPKATALPNGDLLITSATGGTANVYSLATGETRRTTGDMVQRRSDYATASLDDGRVLIVGGQFTDAGGQVVRTPHAEVYAAVPDTFQAVGPLAIGRDRPAAMKLPDGRVAIFGGWTGSTSLRSIEIFDPTTNTFSPGGDMVIARADPEATLLQCPAATPLCSYGGKILITGNVSTPPGELYDPATGISTALPGSTVVTRGFRHTATQLLDGRVLLVGGGGTNHVSVGAEVLDVGTGSSTAVPASTALRLERHTATRLPDGKVLIIGGRAGDQFETDHRLGIFEFDPATLGVRGVGRLRGYRAEHDATTLPDGRLLISGGFGPSGTALADDSFEYFTADPATYFGFTTVLMPPAQQSVAYPTSSLLVSGGLAPYTFTVISGALPPGLSFVNGTISGTPTAAALGGYTFVVQAADSSAGPRRVSMAFTIRVNGITVTTATLPGGAIGVPYNAQLLATGTAPFQWSVTSQALPAGLAMSSSGAITGTPTPTSSPNFSFRVRVEDASGQVAYRWLFIDIASPLAISDAIVESTPAILNEEGYSLTPYTGGRGPFTLTATGLPRGLSVVSGAITGVARQTGQFSIDIQVVDADGRTDQDVVVLAVIAVDQELDNDTEAIPQALTATRRLAQTITAGADGALAGIAVQRLTCTSGTLSITVWNIFGANLADPGNQSGTPLATGGSVVSTQFEEFGYLVFPFRERPFFRANERFAVVFETTGACQFQNVAAGEDDYLGGHAFESTGGGPWQRITGVADLPIITAIQPVGLQYLTDTFIDDSRISPLGGGQYLISGYNYANVFDPNTGIAQLVAGNMSTGRFAHTATALDDGRVLIVGGRNFVDEDAGIFSYTNQAEVYNAGQFQLAGVVDQGRESHTATKLPDGRVVIIGGWRFAPTATTLVASIQVFNPATNTFSSGGALPFGRAAHTATLMACPTGDPTCAWGGKILVSGGERGGGTAALIYDPATQISTATTGNPVVSRGNGHSATLLADGRILFVGGSNVGQAVAELYNPATGTFAAVNGSPALARYGHAAARLQDGDVLIAGGRLWDQFELGARTDMFRYDFETATFAAAGTLRAKRGFYHSTLLANGRVLLVAGDGSDVSKASVEYYDSNQPAVVISNPVLPNGVPGVAYPTTTLTATGGVPPHTLQHVVGSLPPGLVFNNGTISGTVSASAAGWYSFTIEARDSSAIPLVAAQTFEIRVTGNLQITTAALPPGSIGVPYAGQLQATGGFPPYRWTLADTRLPGNLTLNSDGSVTGVPNAAESFSPRIRVEDASGQYVWRNVSLTIAGPLQITTTTVPSTALHDTFTVTLSRTGGQGPFTWSLATGSLPAGLTLSTAGVVSGTSLVAGSFPIEVRVTDGGGSTDLQALALDVFARDQIVGTSTGPTQTFGPARRIAQTLTVGASGALAAIRLNSLFCTAGAITTIEVRPVIGSNVAVPDETAVLATGSAIGVATVALTPRVQLSVGDRIAVVFTTPGECEIRSTITSTTTYPAGHALESVGGGAWQRIANAQDLPVETRILPVNVSYLTASYFSHRSAPLTNGEILIVGATSVADIFTPATGASRRTTSGPPFFRSGMSATSLDNGSVLITGGAGTPTYPLNSMRYVSSGGGPWFGAGSLAQGRASHTATKLFDGRVVVAGGENPAAPNGSNLSSVEIYNPATDTFTSGGSLLNARDDHYAILLPAGRILIAGGDGPLSVELYSAATQTSTAAGQLLTFRQRGTATLLPDGRVLFIGGTSALPSAEIYNPATSTSQVVSNSPLLLRYNHTASLMPDGTVIVAGGTLTDGVGNFEDRADVLRFNPTTQTLTGAGSLAVQRRFASAHTLPDGRLLLIGETSSSSLAGRSAEYIDPTPSANFAIATVVLPDGQRNIAYQTTNLETAGGTAPVTFQLVSGSLPPGLTFVNGTISGTPTGAAGGRYPFVVEAAESSPALRRARGTLTITINAIQITTTTLPNGSVGQPYSTQLQATGIAPFTWSLAFGTIPSGLTLNASGAITGTPTAVQFGFFGARVEDAAGQMATGNLSLQVAAAPPTLQITTTTVRDPIASEEFSWQIQTSGGSGPITFVLESGALPFGLSLTGSGNITGTALKTGDFDILVRATDGQGSTDTQPLSLHVGAFDVQRFATSPPQDAPIATDLIAQTITVGAAGSLYAIRLDATCTAGSSFAVSLQGLDAQGRPDGTLLMSDGPSPVVLALANQTPKLPWEVFVLPGRKFFTIGSRVAVVFSNGAGCSIRKTTDVGGGDSFRHAGGSWQALDPAPMSLVVSTVLDSETEFAFGSWFSNDGTATHLTCPAGGCSYPEQVLLIGNTRALQLYNPATHRTTVTANFLDRFFSEHTATRLADGRVLIAGGWQRLPSESSATVSSASFIFDPATQTVSPTGSMHALRSDHQAVLLRDGRVLVVGGLGPPVGGVRPGILNTEVFNPATGTWTVTAPMADTRWDHTVTRLECPVTEPSCSWGGKVLVFGGFTDTWPVETAELFNPLTNTFLAVPGGEQNRSRAQHATAQLMNGVVLATGGQGVGFAGVLDTTDIYDPAVGPAGTIARGPSLGKQRLGHTATLVGDGTIIVAGGMTRDDGAPTESIERFHQSGSFIGAGSMGTVRREHDAVLLLDGRLAFAGGSSSWNRLGAVSLETFDSTGRFAISTTTLPNARLAEPYDGSIDTFGGDFPKEMQIIAGTLPPGLALQNNAGAFTIHGIPSAAGLFEFTARANEAGGAIAYQRLAILVRESLNVGNAQGGAIAGTPYSEQLSAFGGTGTAWTWVFEPGYGSLPPGIDLTSDGMLVGTPTTGGSFSWMVRVTDNATPPQTVVRRVRLTVSALDREQPLVDPAFGVARVTNINMLRVGQTVIAGRSGPLKNVRVRAFCTTGHLTISIYDTTSTAPYVPTSQIAVEGFNSDATPPAAWREVIFRTPPFLRAGEAYAIAVNSFNGDCTVELGPGTSYTGGSLYINDWAGPETWSPWAGPAADFAFATFVEPVEISAFGSPTVDGRHTVDEWSNASRVNVVMRAGDGERVPATVFFQNDLENLYTSIVYDRRTFDAYTSTDLYFDGDNDNDTFEAGEDILHFNSSPAGFPWFGDYHQSHANCAPDTCWDLDDQRGGTSDGSSRQTYAGETFTVEMQHPIDSGDRFDLSATLGQTLGIRFNHLIWEPNDAQFVQFPGFNESPVPWTLAAPADTCVLAPPGLVSWWSGDATPVFSNDVHGQNHASANGFVTNFPGRFGQAFSVSADGFLSVPDSDNLSPQASPEGELSVEAWVFLPNLPGSNGVNNQGAMIVSKGGPGSFEYGLSVKSGGSVAFTLWQSQGVSHTSVESNAGAVTIGTWHHLVGTYRRGRSTRVYVDGVLTAEQTEQSGASVNGTAQLLIGRGNGMGTFATGLIDDASIYRREVSPEEVKSLYANGKCRPPSQRYTLQVTTVGHGSVTSGSAINCGGDCAESYPSGAGVTLTPIAHAFGGVTFTGFSGDCTGLTCSLTMTRDMTVRATFTTNFRPFATFQTFSTPEDTPIPITLTGGDPEGQPVTFGIVSPPEHGTLSVLSGNQVTYTPDIGYTGFDLFQFDTFDGHFRSGPGFISVIVTPADHSMFTKSYNAGPGNSENGHSVVANADGTYVLGRIVEFGSEIEVVVAKLAASGARIWETRLQATGEQYLQDLIATADGGYALVAATGNNPFRMLIVKLSSVGIIEWQRLTGSGSDDFLSGSIAEDASGNLYVASTLERASADVWAAKLTPSGVVVWQKVFGEAAVDETVTDLAIVDGTPMIVGERRAGLSDGVLIHLDAAGELVSYRRLATSNTDAPKAIVAVPGGGYVLAGTIGTRPWIARFNANHTVAWMREIQTTGITQIDSLAIRVDGLVVLSGALDTSTETPPKWAIGLFLDGSVAFQRQYGESMGRETAVAVSLDAGFVIVGMQRGAGSSFDTILIKTDPSGQAGCALSSITSFGTAVPSVTITTPAAATVNASSAIDDTSAATRVSLTSNVVAVCPVP